MAATGQFEEITQSKRSRPAEPLYKGGLSAIFSFFQRLSCSIMLIFGDILLFIFLLDQIKKITRYCQLFCVKGRIQDIKYIRLQDSIKGSSLLLAHVLLLNTTCHSAE